MAFCTECGADNPAGIKFCTSCGTSINDIAQPIPVMAAAQAGVATATKTAPQTPPGPAYVQPVIQPGHVPAIQNGDAPPASGSRYAVMGTGAYIGTMLLFCIPIIGWLCCIIMAFAAKNQNRRNFAKAMLVFLVVGIILSVAFYFVFSWVSEAIMLYINEASGNMFGEFGGLGDIFDIINSAGLTGN